MCFHFLFWLKFCGECFRERQRTVWWSTMASKCAWFFFHHIGQSGIGNSSVSVISELACCGKVIPVCSSLVSEPNIIGWTNIPTQSTLIFLAFSYLYLASWMASWGTCRLTIWVDHFVFDLDCQHIVLCRTRHYCWNREWHSMPELCLHPCCPSAWLGGRAWFGLCFVAKIAIRPSWRANGLDTNFVPQLIFVNRQLRSDVFGRAAEIIYAVENDSSYLFSCTTAF